MIENGTDLENFYSATEYVQKAINELLGENYSSEDKVNLEFASALNRIMIDITLKNGR